MLYVAMNHSFQWSYMHGENENPGKEFTNDASSFIAGLHNGAVKVAQLVTSVISVLGSQFLRLQRRMQWTEMVPDFKKVE